VNRNLVLVDTGPLVALLRRSDSQHESCVAQARSLPFPFLTSWPVVTEAAWLLRETTDGVDALLGQIEQELIHPLELDAATAGWLRAFMDKYSDLRPDFADASLCYLAEREGISSIFTLDRRDFTVYRTSENRPFHLLPEALTD
jgi:uncharacterized protein